MWGTAVVVAIALAAGILAARLTFALSAGSWRRRRQRKGDDVLFQVCDTHWWPAVRRLNRWMPRDPRCALCYAPFRGMGRLFGVRPSRKNPRFCTSCFEAAPIGGHNVDIGVLYADVRGFTALAERMPPDEAARILDRFYVAAVRALVPRDAILDKFDGDAVMALFIPQFPSLRDRTADTMLSAAADLLLQLSGPPAGTPQLDVGVGLNYGPAYVGNVGSGDVKDFTAIGDVVNTAARLQANAGPGQVIVADEVHDMLLEWQRVDSTPVELQVKGKANPVRAYRIQFPIATPSP